MKKIEKKLTKSPKNIAGTIKDSIFAGKSFFIYINQFIFKNLMKELVDKINQEIAIFTENAALQVEKGNKAAGARARKASLELEKALKEFRKVSIATSK